MIERDVCAEQQLPRSVRPRGLAGPRHQLANQGRIERAYIRHRVVQGVMHHTIEHGAGLKLGPLHQAQQTLDLLGHRRDFKSCCIGAAKRRPSAAEP